MKQFLEYEKKDLGVLWIVRLASVPVLLSLPIISSAAGLLIAHENQGDSLPFFSCMGFVGGAAAAVLLAPKTVFVPKGNLRRGVAILAMVVGIETVQLILASVFAVPS